MHPTVTSTHMQAQRKSCYTESLSFGLWRSTCTIRKDMKRVLEVHRNLYQYYATEERKEGRIKWTTGRQDWRLSIPRVCSLGRTRLHHPPISLSIAPFASSKAKLKVSEFYSTANTILKVISSFRECAPVANISCTVNALLQMLGHRAGIIGDVCVVNTPELLGLMASWRASLKLWTTNACIYGNLS